MRFQVTGRGEAMVELARLAETEDRLRVRVDKVTADARAAQAELTEARAALIALERAAGPDGPSTQQRKLAEGRVAKAEQEAGLPWAERRAGAEHGAQDARHAIVAHITGHMDALVDELEENGRAAAEQVDATGQSFLDACDRHAAAERAMIETLALARPMRPGDVTRPKSGQARSAVQALLANGGEDGPQFLAREREQATAA